MGWAGVGSDILRQPRTLEIVFPQSASVHVRGVDPHDQKYPPPVQHSMAIKYVEWVQVIVVTLFLANVVAWTEDVDDFDWVRDGGVAAYTKDLDYVDEVRETEYDGKVGMGSALRLILIVSK